MMWGVFYTPTCSDGLKNQDEEDADCGGPCATCELRTLSYPSVSRKLFFMDPNGNATDVAIQIKNPNSSWGLKSFDYRVDFADSTGKILPGSLYGRSFLMPGATQWIMEAARFSSAELNDVEFKITTSTIDWNKLRPYVSENEFVIRDKQYKLLAPPASGYAELTGVIENKSSFSVNEFEVQGVLYDKEKRIIGFGKTKVLSLRPGQVKEFRIFWPRQFTNRNPVANFDVFANINFLADESFLQRYKQ